MTIVPTSDGKVDAYASGITQLILDISSLLCAVAAEVATVGRFTKAGREHQSSCLLSRVTLCPYSPEQRGV